MITEKDLQGRIARTLDGLCPAFSRQRNSKPSIWHECQCSADANGVCICVWHTRDYCEAGKWPQLAFIEVIQKKRREDRLTSLADAKEAIERANNGTNRS